MSLALKFNGSFSKSYSEFKDDPRRVSVHKPSQQSMC